MNMEFKTDRDFSAFGAQDWNALAQAGVSDTPFARYEYLNQWWLTRGGGEWPQAELLLISATENGRLIGIAPLFRARHDGREALLLVGSIEISDYLDLIVRAADLPRFVNGLLDHLAALPDSRGLPLDWYNLPEASPSVAALQAEAEARGWELRREMYRATPHIPLRGDFEAYLAGIEKKQRHEIRRKMRRALEHESPVRFYIVEEAAALDSEMEAFFQLMIQDEKKAAFLTEAMRAQLQASARLALAGGYLWLAFLEVNGVKAAAALNFDYANKLWGYNSGVHRAYMELSPGWVLLGHQLQWACEHGRSEFDFMRGDEEYKYRFGAVDRHVLRLSLASR
jgi:CelD/BcsL family acetyltransferase involved in cellulose biosynthesis